MIDVGGSRPWWKTLCPMPGVLNCIRMKPSKQSCVHLFLSALGCRCDVTGCSSVLSLTARLPLHLVLQGKSSTVSPTLLSVRAEIKLENFQEENSLRKKYTSQFKDYC